jgi:hypothetical protein
MKKYFTIFAVCIVMLIVSCQPKHEGPTQEDFDKLSKKLVESEARIAMLEDGVEEIWVEVEDIRELQEEQLAPQSKATTGTAASSGGQTTPWVEWTQLSGGSRKYYKDKPYTGGFTKYGTNRVKEIVGYFKDGYRSGKWTWYNKNGTVKDVKYY